MVNSVLEVWPARHRSWKSGAPWRVSASDAHQGGESCRHQRKWKHGYLTLNDAAPAIRGDKAAIFSQIQGTWKHTVETDAAVLDTIALIRRCCRDIEGTLSCLIRNLKSVANGKFSGGAMENASCTSPASEQGEGNVMSRTHVETAVEDFRSKMIPEVMDIY